MVFNQVQNLVKMANDLQLNMTWSITLCIYLLPIHPFIHLINYLPTYYSPPTYYYLPMYLHIPFHLPTYIPTFVFHFCMTYLPIYLHIIYLFIHPLTYLILTTRCNHEIYPLCLTIKFNQILYIMFNLNLADMYMHQILALGLA